MEDLQRVTAKIFASNAAAEDIGQYGSALSGTKVLTDDIATIQGLPAYEVGWRAAVLSTRNYPTLQEMNGLQKTFSYQLAYILQKGIAKWDSGTEYYINDFCSVGNEIYVSIADNNINHDPTELNSVYWNLYSPGLGTYANQSLSNLNTTGQAVLDAKANVDLSNLSATGESHFANPSLSNLDATGQAVLDAKADVDLSNINSTAKAYINNSKALLTGAVGNNADIYADIHKYAHSTYDSSKFTVVGSSNITNDGVVHFSENSNNDYLELPEQFKPGDKPWEIYIEGKIGGSWNTAPTLFTATSSNNNYGSVQFGIGAGHDRFRLSLNLDDTQTDFTDSVDVLGIVPIFNTEYWFKLAFTGTAYQIWVSNDNGITYTLNNSLNSSTAFAQNQTAPSCIGTGRAASSAQKWYGSIDLKQFSITVDGVPVFSGNKTGIDTIKPDDYTVVGAPTISADGIASGFSTSNYLYKTISISAGSKIETITKLNDVISASDSRDFFGLASGSTCLINARLSASGQNITWIYADSATTRSSKTVSFNYIGDNYIKTVYYNGALQIYSGATLDTLSLLDTITGIYDLPVDKIAIGIAYTLTAYPFTNGSIDLNSFQIYVDDDLVYQPCLKIPYTESKTGSKVVDVYARPRVQDMYSQFGYAPYYTIDEVNENFTLPMGEIYGMKIDKTTPHIVDSYQNGASWYRVWSDGLIEQGGDLVLDTSNYTFLKAYTSYARVFVQAYTNNTAAATNGGAWLLSAMPTTTGFSCPIASTYYEGGYWYARGY